MEGALAAAEILEGIGKIKEKAEHIVIVTNEVFSDGDSYSSETMAYRKVLGGINQKIAEVSDVVIEVVAGIPVVVKKNESKSLCNGLPKLQHSGFFNG